MPSPTTAETPSVHTSKASATVRTLAHVSKRSN
jgi:hypothetical protein